MKIAICDDDASTLEDSYELVKTVLEEKGIECSISKYDNPIDLISCNERFSIVFLDIKMNDVDGIRIAEMLRSANDDCLIFFVTNYETYIDDALNQRAFRYWTKPLEKTKLSYGIDSALKELKAREEFITVNIEADVVKVLAKNIIFIDIRGRKTRIVTTRGELFAKDSFGKIAAQLNSCDYFCKTHRSYMVNMRYITGQTHSSITCEYMDKRYDVYVSRRNYDTFHKKFIYWIGGR